MSNTNLIHIHNNKPFTDSLVIAEGVGLKHPVVIKTIRKYENDFSEFDKLVFKTSLNTQGSATEYVELNEDHATYLITLFRNSEKVREFKIRLVKEFRKAINEITRLKTLLSDPSRLEAIAYKRDTHKMMQDMKIAIMERDGLKWTKAEAIKENMFCNRALTGKWAAILPDDSVLDAYDAKLLGKIRDYNAVLIGIYGKKQDVRKKPMDDFVTNYRIKYPKLQLELI